MSSLGTDLPKEAARVRALMLQYKSMESLPNVNVKPVLFMMESALRSADDAMISGDPAAMIRSYEELKGFEK